MKALLALEDGFVLEGRSFTGPCEGGGEVIFNTGMTGYQEILTDPSYYGQMVGALDQYLRGEDCPPKDFTRGLFYRGVE